MRLEKIAAKALERANYNRYLLSTAVAKRANELSRGAKPLVNMDVKNEKYTDIAIAEIAEGLVKIDQVDTH